MEKVKNKKITETLEEKVLRLEREIETETVDFEATSNEVVQIENNLKKINERSEETKNKIQREQDKVEETNVKITEIEQQIKILLKENKQEKVPKSEEKNLEFPSVEETENVKEEKSAIPEILTEKKVEENLEKVLTPEENKTVEKEMEVFTPEPFEPEEVKKNKGLFLKNLIVKSVSGVKYTISENLKKIVGKMRSKALLGVAVLGLFAGATQKDGSTSYVVPKENLDGSKNSFFTIKQEATERLMQQKYLEAFHLRGYKQTEQIKKDLNLKELEQFEKLVTSIDTSLYNKLTPGAREIYLYALANVNDTYYIVDKPTATIYAISPDGKEIGSSVVVLGTLKGEAPNTADVDGSRYIGTTTPAGKYEIGYERIHPDDSATYKGKLLSFHGMGGLALHIVYPGEYWARMAAINTPTTDDNRMSWGCTNVPEEFWAKCIKPYVKHNIWYTLFISPDDQSKNTLNPNTGKVEQTSTSEIDFIYNNSI